MYKIDRMENRIVPLDLKSFSGLGFSERKHLQEWIENCPQVLATEDGEELLIIQKEFDGFDDTRERLDLLAIDKDGNLVIIENKLDDSGRDVVWQALKYASYCANLNKTQVVDIYQRYLNQKAVAVDQQPEIASSKIIEFLEVDDLEAAVINKGQSQRIIFVAARYRKEVTNTVLWLSQFGIACQCFKVTPYVSGSEEFLSFEQIIPTPESAAFMIGMVAKENEEKSTDFELKQRNKLRLQFWDLALDAFRKSNCGLYSNISPGKDHWLCAGSGIRAIPYNLIFGKREARVELWISRHEAEVNSFVFNELYYHKKEIEEEFGQPLIWLPLPEKKACRIQFAKQVDGYDKANWPEIIDWMVVNMTKFESVFHPRLMQINQQLKSGNIFDSNILAE